jgi:hypothetical protein
VAKRDGEHIVNMCHVVQFGFRKGGLCTFCETGKEKQNALNFSCGFHKQIIPVGCIGRIKILFFNNLGIGCKGEQTKERESYVFQVDGGYKITTCEPRGFIRYELMRFCTVGVSTLFLTKFLAESTLAIAAWRSKNP